MSVLHRAKRPCNALAFINETDYKGGLMTKHARSPAHAMPAAQAESSRGGRYRPQGNWRCSRRRKHSRRLPRHRSARDTTAPEVPRAARMQLCAGIRGYCPRFGFTSNWITQSRRGAGSVGQRDSRTGKPSLLGSVVDAAGGAQGLCSDG